MDDIAIKVEGVSKIFKLPHEKAGSIKSAIVNFSSRDRRYEMQKALDDISFEVKKGEFFGIVGRNGSGKSTLLKLLAGIYVPTKGQVHVNGKLTPFIELGVGFNPELTGRENVFLNGALLGFDRKEMQAMYKDIVEFAELEKFMDQKLKNYSSGMQVRLAFSIATRVQSNILLIDEVLAVGDLDFQKKCYNYFLELKRQNRTIVFVTHDMGAIRRFCTKCILIHDGKMIKEGDADEVADLYENMNLKASEQWISNYNVLTKKDRQGTQQAVIEKVETFLPESGKDQKSFNSSEKIGVRIYFKAKEAMDAPSVGFIFQNENDVTVFATNNQILKLKTKPMKKNQPLIMEAIVDNIFTDGEYTITCAIESEDFSQVYDRIEYIHKFIIGGHRLAHALTHPHHEMKISYSNS
jgi:ABC-2 type transport system ATP-binding protein